jgi:hypothetical protein
MRKLTAIRDSVRAGADFAAMAQKHSQDGSAQQGGDLGFFGRGQMVAPFEQAAYALQPGQVSDIVETPFGYHLIKVEERKQPSFDEMKAGYVEQVKTQARFEAEEKYIKGLVDPLGVKVQDGAYDVVKELAAKPNAELTARAAGRALTTYQGGQFTAGEFLEMVRRFQPAQRAQIGGANEEQLEQMLKGLTQNEILVTEARRQGLQIQPAARDSVEKSTRLQLEGAVESAGLRKVQPQQGETVQQAVDRKVTALLEGILKGEANVVPLGLVAYPLRTTHDARVFERAFPAVVEKVQNLRAAAAPQNPNLPPGAQPVPLPQPQRPDSGTPR